MTPRTTLLSANIITAATVLAALGGPAAVAQPVDGLYIGLGAGGNILQQERTRASPGLQLAPKRIDTNPGGVGVGSIGYGFGNGFRVEIEGNVRHNSVRQISGFSRGPANTTGDQFGYGAMANVMFDLDIGENWVYPYFGMGAGFLDSHLYNVQTFQPGTYLRLGSNAWSVNAAYQGIFGASFPLAAVPGLSLTAEYRFLGLIDGPSFGFQRNLGPNGQTGKLAVKSDYNHSLLLGVRYAFDTAPPAPEAEAAVPSVAQASRTYLVFFDWDRADLTARARQIIADAATASTRTQTTRIDVQGNADRSGTQNYNQRLSLRRAEAVSAELIRHGVPRAAISVSGAGDTQLLVQTAAGVREAQNRRVVINLR